MSPTPDRMFQTISKIGLVAGILWFSCEPLSTRRVAIGYGILVSLLMIMVVSFIFILSSLWKFSEGGWTNTTLGVNFSYIVFLIIHNIFSRKSIMQIFREFSSLKEKFLKTSQDDKEDQDFNEKLRKQEERIDMFIKFQFWFNFSLSPLNTLVKMMTWNKLVDFNNKNVLIYAIYFDPSDSFMFWPTVSLQAVSLHILCVLQTASDLYLLKVLFLLIMCLKYLRIKLGKILSLQETTPGEYINLLSKLSFQETSPGESMNISSKFQENPPGEFMNLSSNIRKLISTNEPLVLTGMYKNYKNSLDCINNQVNQWIKQHIYILKLYSEFLHLYTPVLLAYFANVLLGDCLGLFGVTQDEGNFFSLAEKIIIGSYFVQNAMTLTLICLAGTSLACESREVFADGIHARWYDCDQSTLSSLSVVCTVAQRPLRLTPRSSATAELSTHTLVWMLRTMVSVYVALTQIKEAAFKN